MTTEPADTEVTLRELCGRAVGYDRTQAIEHALRSICLCVTHRAALVLLGEVEADLISIARALQDSSWAVTAARSARGGSLCVFRRWLPADFLSAVPLLRDPTAAVQLIVCADSSFDSHPLATLPVPIMVPSIQERATEEVPRIVDAYAFDAICTLGDACFFDEDRAWVLKHAAGSLAEIEIATLRLVVLRQAGSIAVAAKRLAMSGWALRHWLHKCRRWRPRGTTDRRRRPGKGDE